MSDDGTQSDACKEFVEKVHVHLEKSLHHGDSRLEDPKSSLSEGTDLMLEGVRLVEECFKELSLRIERHVDFLRRHQNAEQKIEDELPEKEGLTSGGGEPLPNNRVAKFL